MVQQVPLSRELSPASTKNAYVARLRIRRQCSHWLAASPVRSAELG